MTPYAAKTRETRRISRSPCIPFALALAVPLIAGCDDADHDHDGGEHECPAEDPEISSFMGDTSSLAAGSDIELMIHVENFEFGHGGHDDDGDSHAGDDDGAMECAGGHVHIYLDSLMENPLAMPESSPTLITIPAETAAGSHMLVARLHNYDHTIVEPEVTAELEITVE
jgi:hypothetical protein